MSIRTAVYSSVLVVFCLFSTWVVMQTGYLGLFLTALDNPGSMQIFGDLCLSLFLLAGFMVRDAREKGLVVWPWLAAIPFLGSIAPLAYMVWRESRR